MAMSYEDRKQAHAELPRKTVKIITVGNSQAITVPREYLDFIKETDLFGNTPNGVTWSPHGGGLGHRGFRIDIDTHYERPAETHRGAIRAGRDAFIEFYRALCVAPGLEDEAEPEIGDAWMAAFDSFKSAGFDYGISHSCVDADEGYTDVDAEIQGCQGDEMCGLVLRKSKWSDDAWKSFMECAEKCWPDKGTRDEFLYPL